MDKIIVIGGKGTAINIAEHIQDAQINHNSKVELLGFAIDDPSLGREINGIPILCKTTELSEIYRQKDVKFIFALYRPDRMRERVELLKSYGIDRQRYATFVHPSAFVATSASLGKGTVILSQAVVNSNVIIGDFNIVNSGVIIEHDSQIGNNNFIAASCCIGAHVTIGKGVFVGLKTSIREGVSLENYAFVGMGSNVLKSVSSEMVVYGNPAKK